MQVHVLLDEKGYLPDAYGKYCAAEDKIAWSCVRSFPFEVTDIPRGTVALAWIFLDWDSMPVRGFPWMHWAAWTEVSPTAVAEGLGLAIDDDASRCCDELHQAFNSATKDDRRDIAVGYVGPCPPNGDHVYTLRVVALDALPQMEPVTENGVTAYWPNQLVNAAQGHVLDQASVRLPSRC